VDGLAGVGAAGRSAQGRRTRSLVLPIIPTDHLDTAERGSWQPRGPQLHEPNCGTTSITVTTRCLQGCVEEEWVTKKGDEQQRAMSSKGQGSSMRRRMAYEWHIGRSHTRRHAAYPGTLW